MIPDESERLKKIEAAVERIERGMFGDEKLDQFGLISRVANHATRLKTLEIVVFRVGASAVGAGFVIGLLYKLATDWLPRT